MILAIVLAAAQLINSSLVGPEGITITAISSPTAVLQFGVGSNWCTTNITSPKLPLLVSYANPANPLLCATDPAPGVVKSIVAQQQAAAYTVTYTLAGVSKTVTIPALPPPPPTIITTRNCTGTLTTDSTGAETLSLVCTQ